MDNNEKRIIIKEWHSRAKRLNDEIDLALRVIDLNSELLAATWSILELLTRHVSELTGINEEWLIAWATEAQYGRSELRAGWIGQETQDHELQSISTIDELCDFIFEEQGNE